LGDDKPEIPWFPEHIEDLNGSTKFLLELPDPSMADHPYFSDKDYVKRREAIQSCTKDWQIGHKIPTVKYNEDDLKCWGYVYRHLKPLHQKYFCEKFNTNFAKLEKYCNLRENSIPQLEDLSQYLQEQTGFRLKPVHGMISQREFLNCLAHKVFCCTQYVRHSCTPEFAPEPDLIHEVFGHVAMFADPEFAELSHKLGMYSIGQSDENIKKLGALYIYTVEFGAYEDGEEPKLYGAGPGACIGEIKNFIENPQKRRKFDPLTFLPTDYPLQVLQPTYLVSESLNQAKEAIRKYSHTLKKPIITFYDHDRQKVIVNKEILMGPKP